jgi:hypothetical protein
MGNGGTRCVAAASRDIAGDLIEEPPVRLDMGIAKMLSGRGPIFATLFVFLMVGCRGPERRQTIAFRADNDSMREEVLRSVPIGTQLATAEKIMSENGFECSVLLDEKTQRTKLFCDASEPVDFWVGRRWLVNFYIDANTVSDVKVTSGYVGP